MLNTQSLYSIADHISYKTGAGIQKQLHGDENEE